MIFIKSSHIFDYEWDLVSAAQWQKYPNANSSHIQHVDVLDRRVDPETGILITERLLTVKHNVPTFFLKILGTGETQFVREVSTIDSKKKSFVLVSENLSLCNFMKCEEETSYTALPGDPEKTQFTQKATMTVHGFLSRWESLIEDFTVKKFNQNSQFGREGVLSVLERFVSMKEAVKPGSMN